MNAPSPKRNARVAPSEFGGSGQRKSRDQNRPRIGDQADRRFAVYTVKHDGRRVLFQRYENRRDAEAVVQTLGNVKCQATIEEVAR